MPKVMEIVTPLGEDLLFHAMHAREELGRLFEFHLDLLSLKKALNPDDILGKNVTVKMTLPDDRVRYFNGFVTRFAQGGSYGRYEQYSAVVRPWLWFLTRTADCRIFQDMSVPDIVKKVFADHPADYSFELTGTYQPRIYCVQYRETDFNFVSRLLEEEGIYYYIRHSDGHNTVVLTDSTSKHAPVQDYATIEYIAPEQVFRPEFERITSWDFAREVQPGVYVHEDHNFELPYNRLTTRKVLPRSYSPSNYEIYDYPGRYVEYAIGQQLPVGEQYAGVRIDEFGTQYELAHGATNARGMTTGALFTLDAHPRDDQNREYLVVSTTYDLQFSGYEAHQDQHGTQFRCTFVAMSTRQQFRPRRLTPKPTVQGPQTAVVVGPAGEEIYTDQYGRVKVQFHWDRQGKKDDKSSCWIRVSHPWAGKNWGAIAIPRIMQEVIVDFLEGDPDQPIVTGRVYNADQMPPYDLPANKTQTGYKTRSSLKGTPANFNEIRFEDKKGSEQLYIHAEKNQDIEVENDETHWVGHDRTKTIDHDETTHVKHDRTETVDNNETITIHGNRTETVDKNETITVHQNRTEKVDINETISIGGNRTITVSKNETATVALMRTHTVGVNEAITVGAAQEITVGAMQAVTVGAAQTINVGANQTTTVGSNQSNSIGGNQANTIGGNQNTGVGKNVDTTIGADESRKVAGSRKSDVGKDDLSKVGKNFAVVAGDEIVLKTGDASITLKKDGTITIKGKDITLQGSGNINAKASSKIVMKGSKIDQN